METVSYFEVRSDVTVRILLKIASLFVDGFRIPHDIQSYGSQFVFSTKFFFTRACSYYRRAISVSLSENLFARIFRHVHDSTLPFM